MTFASSTATVPGYSHGDPTAPWLKLWRNSLDHLGRQAEGLERVFSDDDKYRLPLATVLTPEPIRKLVFLEGHEVSSTTTEIEEVPRLEAIPLLMNLTHHSYLLEATGQREENFLPLRPRVVPGQSLPSAPSLGPDAPGVDRGRTGESLARGVDGSRWQGSGSYGNVLRTVNCDSTSPPTTVRSPTLTQV